VHAPEQGSAPAQNLVRLARSEEMTRDPRLEERATAPRERAWKSIGVEMSREREHAAGILDPLHPPALDEAAIGAPQSERGSSE
jgi:hypothetical protein